MKAGAIIGIIIAIIAVIAVIYFINQPSETSSSAGERAKLNIVVPASAKTHTIEITSSGFSPSSLEINSGDKVTWVNNGNAESWPASAIHPTHTVYPGSDIKKCGTSEEGKIFDACKGFANGESWSFTFNEKGTWNYHDHLQAGKVGKIIVN